VRLYDEAAVARALDWGGLIEALRGAFAGSAHAPARHRHEIPGPPDPDAHLALMPAWSAGHVGVKVGLLVPGNAARGRPPGSSVYVLASRSTGEILAVMDAAELTVRRTAAVAALAASYLARAEVHHLAVVGTGRVARHLAPALAAVRPVERVSIWGRTPARAQLLAAALADRGVRAGAVDDLGRAVRAGDVIVSATASPDPILQGAWLKEGAHLTVLGGHSPSMREADAACVARARVFVDTRAGALAEAGEIRHALAAGARAETLIVGDLPELCRGVTPGRSAAGEITFFRSVGTAVADLAAALLVHRGGVPVE
jgi:ornithine cyclodeaminase